MELTSHPRRWAAAVVGAATLAGFAGAPAFAATPTEPTGPMQAYLLRAVPGEMSAALADVRSLHGTVTRTIALINGASVQVPADAVAALSVDRHVKEFTPDGAVRLLSSSSAALPPNYNPVSDQNSLYNIEKDLGVRYGWAAGVTGKGVDVAVLDSGVAPVAGLDGSNKVVYGPDLSPESQNPATANIDTFGHGTHMAGIIAGHDNAVAGATGPTMAQDKTDFLGVAPDARIVSVKAADGRGNTDVSQVIAGIDWVVQHAHDPGMNIRVLNLSFGTDSAQSYLVDPLAYAAEAAWRSGIVVVVSAGNSGAANGRLTDPAIDPYVLAVGAETGHGATDDVNADIADFSSTGDGVRNPDLVAPGAHVQSLRVPGSYVDAQFGSTGKINDRFFRGSGTSQAAALTSGLAALIVSAIPTLTPDQVKAILVQTAVPLTKADKKAQGHGRIDLFHLFTVRLATATQSFPVSTGTGSLDASRGSSRLVLNGVSLDGERDIFGQAFDAKAMAAAELAGHAWAGGVWNGHAWAGDSWDGHAWAGHAWAGSSWDGHAWAGHAWATGTWDGHAWADGSWNGHAWAGSAWAGSAWAGHAWADDAWQ